MAKYNALQLSQLIQDVAKQNGATVTPDELVTGVSIILAESGGDAAAIGSDPHDRGLWQINSVAHPDISDAVAFDPVQSTQAVYNLTNGFQVTKFNQIWVDAKGRKSAGLNPTNIANAQKAIAQAIANGGGNDIWGVISGDKSIGQVVGDAGDGVGAVTSLAPDWIASLGKLLGNLLSGNWWKRLGIGALGVAVIILALILLFGKDVEKAAVT